MECDWWPGRAAWNLGAANGAAGDLWACLAVASCGNTALWADGRCSGGGTFSTSSSCTSPGVSVPPGFAPGHVPPHLPLPAQGLPVPWWQGAPQSWGWNAPAPYAVPLPSPLGGLRSDGAPTGPQVKAATSAPASPARSASRARPYGGTPGPERGDEAEEGSSSAATSDLRSMLRRRARESERPKSSIGSVRIEEFAGDRCRYLKWKRAIEAQEKLYRLDPGELSMLVYLSTKAEARDVLDQVPLSELTGPEGSIVLWRLLDESFGESGAEQFERAERELNTYRRLPGQPVATYLAAMRRLRAQYTRIDPETFISDRAWAQRLLSRASLTKRERLDVYYSAGGSYTTAGIEAALRHRCAQVHEDERKVPTSPSSRSPWSTASSSRSSGASTTSTAASRKFSFKGSGKRKPGQGAYVTEGPDDLDDEDLEQEIAEDAAEKLEDEEPAVEPSQEDSDDQNDEAGSAEEATPDEIREAFAAGWKAKAKTAGTRKARGWAQPSGGRSGGGSSARTSSTAGSAKSLADKKKSSTCSSCGQRGHWRGDPQCPNVVSGRDPLHRKPETAGPNEVNFTNFTFMVGGGEASTSWTAAPLCPTCFVPVTVDQKFCRECGTKLLAKRDWEVVGPAREEQPPRPMKDVRLPKSALTKTSKPDSHTVKMTPLETIAALDNLTKEDKKHLKYLLAREEDDDGEPDRAARDQRPVLRNNKGYPTEAGPSAVDPPWSSSTALPVDVAPLDRGRGRLQPPSKKDERGRDKAEGVRKRELDEFRAALWRRRLLWQQRGKLDVHTRTVSLFGWPISTGILRGAGRVT